MRTECDSFIDKEFLCANIQVEKFVSSLSRSFVWDKFFYLSLNLYRILKYLLKEKRMRLYKNGHPHFLCYNYEIGSVFSSRDRVDGLDSVLFQTSVHVSRNALPIANCVFRHVS